MNNCVFYNTYSQQYFTNAVAAANGYHWVSIKAEVYGYKIGKNNKLIGIIYDIFHKLEYIEYLLREKFHNEEILELFKYILIGFINKLKLESKKEKEYFIPIERLIL